MYSASKLFVGDVYRILFPYISASLVTLEYTKVSALRFSPFVEVTTTLPKILNFLSFILYSALSARTEYSGFPPLICP